MGCTGDNCVACGKPIERGENGWDNHHCNPTTENRIDGARKSNPSPRTKQTDAQRINYGFWLLSLTGDRS